MASNWGYGATVACLTPDQKNHNVPKRGFLFGASCPRAQKWCLHYLKNCSLLLRITAIIVLGKQSFLRLRLDSFFRAQVTAAGDQAACSATSSGRGRRDGALGPRRRRPKILQILPKCCQMFGSFSAVSAPIFAGKIVNAKYAFFSIFLHLQDYNYPISS